MTIPDSRADALARRGRNLPGYGGCGICGSADIESTLRAPPRIESPLRIRANRPATPSPPCIDGSR